VDSRDPILRPRARRGRRREIVFVLDCRFGIEGWRCCRVGCETLLFLRGGRGGSGGALGLGGRRLLIELPEFASLEIHCEVVDQSLARNLQVWPDRGERRLRGPNTQISLAVVMAPRH